MRTREITLAMSNGTRPTVRAHVFGEWAAHLELVPDRGGWKRGIRWRVSHVGVGRNLPIVMTPSRAHAIGLARALAAAGVSAPKSRTDGARIQTISAAVATALESQAREHADRDAEAARRAVLEPLPAEDPEVG